MSEERLLNVDYQDGLLTAKDAKAFARRRFGHPRSGGRRRGRVASRFCNELPAGGEYSVAGRVGAVRPVAERVDGELRRRLRHAKHAEQYLKFAQQSAKSCAQPYVMGSSTFSPGAAPKIPKVGDERVALGGDFRFPNGQDRRQRRDRAPAGPGRRLLADAQHRADHEEDGDRWRRDGPEAGRQTATRRRRQAAAEEEEQGGVLRGAVAEGRPRACVSVGLQEPEDCRYAVAQGAGGVDVGFSKTRDTADRSYPAIAKGEPIAVKGAADALFSTSTNQFGQVSEIVYVRLKNGDMFTIGLRGDDVPKDQKVQLTKAASAAVKNA